MSKSVLTGFERTVRSVSRARQRQKKALERERIRQMKQNERINHQNAIANIERRTRFENEDLEEQLAVLCNPQRNYNLNIYNERECIDNYYTSLKKKHHKSNYQKINAISLTDFFRNNNVPKKNILKEAIKKDIKEKRIKLENEYENKYNKIYLKEIEKENIKRKKEYEDSLNKKNAEIDAFNNTIDERKKKYNNCNKKEIEEVLKYFLNNRIEVTILQTSGNETYYVNNRVFYNEKSRVLNLDLIYFSPNVFSKIPSNKKYIKSDDSFRITYLSGNELNRIYEGYLLGTSLYVIYGVALLFKNSIDYIYLNSYIDGINPYTGEHTDVLVLSSNNTRDELSKINITTITPKEYFKNRKSRISKKMSELIPVEPLIESTNKDDIEHYSLENINYNLDGFEFENFSKELLQANGFEQVTVTQASGDYGADVIAYKDDIKYAIQCKKYSSPVGLKAVQEVIASKSIYKCHVAVVITNNYFTPAAIKLANENNVLLWDKDKLLIMLDKLKEKNMI